MLWKIYNKYLYLNTSHPKITDIKVNQEKNPSTPGLEAKNCKESRFITHNIQVIINNNASQQSKQYPKQNNREHVVYHSALYVEFLSVWKQFHFALASYSILNA